MTVMGVNGQQWKLLSLHMIHDDNDDDVNNNGYDDGDGHEIYLRLVKKRFCYVYAEKSSY